MESIVEKIRSLETKILHELVHDTTQKSENHKLIRVVS